MNERRGQYNKSQASHWFSHHVTMKLPLQRRVGISLEYVKRSAACLRAAASLRLEMPWSCGMHKFQVILETERDDRAVKI